MIPLALFQLKKLYAGMEHFMRHAMLGLARFAAEGGALNTCDTLWLSLQIAKRKEKQCNAMKRKFKQTSYLMKA